MHWLDLNAVSSRHKKSSSKESVVVYTKTFYNPRMYPNTCKPKLLKSLGDFSLQELMELELKLAEPKSNRKLIAR